MKPGGIGFPDHLRLRDFHLNGWTDRKRPFVEINIDEATAGLKRSNQERVVRGTVRNVVERVTYEDHIDGSCGQPGVVGFR